MKTLNLLKGAVAAAALVVAGSAAAVPISIGFNFAGFGTIFTGNGAGGDITLSTLVTETTGNPYQVNGIDPNTVNNIGLTLGNLTVTLTNPMPLTLNAQFVKTFMVGNTLFTENLTVTSVDTGPGSRSILATGTIDDGAGGFDPTTVFFSASYTQNQNGQINASFNNSTTPPPRIPEPASLALVGLALAGVGFSARRRAAK